MKNFINQYSLSKTFKGLSWFLKEERQNILKIKLIEQDEGRAKSYQNEKKIDGFHQDFIELAMSQVQLTKLQEFVDLYCQNFEAKNKMRNLQTNLRKHKKHCKRNSSML